MHYVLYGLNGLLMIFIPFLIANAIYRRYRPGWGLFAIGAVTFIAAQILHIPFNTQVEQSGPLPDPAAGTVSLLLWALFYGLSAGVFEEVARYLTMRYWAKDARWPRHALMMGAGHGGIESILLGLLFLVNTSVLFGANLGYFTSLVPAEALPQIQQQVALMLEVPLGATLLGALERLFAITAHIAMSLMVLKAVGGRLYWLVVAILWHTLLNSSALVVQFLAGTYAAEIPIAIMAVMSAILIWRWVRDDGGTDESDASRGEDAIEPLQLRPVGASITEEGLEDSRYQ